LLASKTTLKSSKNPSVFGQRITLTASVAPVVKAPTLTGIVTFLDGAVTLGTASLKLGKATITTAGLSTGTHTITAVYGGTTVYGSSSSTVLIQKVNPASTKVVLTSSANTAMFGLTVTLTAKVSPLVSNSVLLTGIVTFQDGSSMLGTATLSNGVATFQTAQLSKGKHALTAIYSGDNSFATSFSLKLTETID